VVCLFYPVHPKKLKEISGIAYNNHLIYAIEDSGNDNEVLVLDTLGSITKKITINN
jgi:3-deoxy-D-manno-octulosonic-acid transferase